MTATDPLLRHASGTPTLVLWRRREGGGDYQVGAVPSAEAATWQRECAGCGPGMTWCCSSRSELWSVSQPKRRSLSEPRSTSVRALRWTGVRWSQCRPVRRGSGMPEVVMPFTA